MHLMLNQKKPGDWVVATGETRSVRELCDYVFSKLGMNYKAYVKVDARFKRPHEINMLKGDATDIKEVLGWKPKYTFESMMDEMIDYWMTKE